MVNFIKISAARTFPSIPPPSLFVTLIYFWHCALAFSKGKTVGNLISGPIRPFFSITSSPVIDVTVAAPWCKWLISVCFHPSGLTRTDQRTSRFSGSNGKVCFCCEARFWKCDKINKSVLGSSKWSQVLSLVSQTGEASMHRGPI